MQQGCFLSIGHTKFSPHWCFDLFKRPYSRMKVGSLQNIAEVVNTSAECNIAQLVFREDGTTIVPTLDWTDFFATRFKKIPGIKKLHHFRVTSSSPGHIFVRERSDTVEQDVNLLKEPWTPEANTKPDIIPPKGLNPMVAEKGQPTRLADPTQKAHAAGPIGYNHGRAASISVLRSNHTHFYVRVRANAHCACMHICDRIWENPP